VDVTNLRRAFAVAAVVFAGLVAPVSPASAVVGGQEAADGQFGSVVSINIQGVYGKSHACGGVLRDVNTVITTAGCVDGHAAPSIFVLFGGVDRTRLAQQSGVSAVRQHASYDAATGRSNVALLKLATPAQLSGTVRTAPLELPVLDEPLPGTRIHFAGWGKTHAGDTTLPVRQHYANMPVISRAACNTAYGAGTITTGMFCAKAQVAKSACDADAGGPVFGIDGAVVGLVTAKNGCTHPGKPDVYVRTGAFRAWLSQNV
jgi:secreted trypsin-like serine protease